MVLVYSILYQPCLQLTSKGAKSKKRKEAHEFGSLKRETFPRKVCTVGVGSAAHTAASQNSETIITIGHSQFVKPKPQMLPN